MHLPSLPALALSLLPLVASTAAQSCTPQAPGSCNLGLGGKLYPAGRDNSMFPTAGTPLRIDWQWAVVYDHACAQRAVVARPAQGDAIHAAGLAAGPVVLTALATGAGADFTQAGMCYGATAAGAEAEADGAEAEDYCYKGAFACSKDGPYWLSCQHAFPCAV